MALRVGILTTALDDFRGGMGRYIEGLVGGLIDLSPDDMEFILIHGSGKHHELYDLAENFQFPLISSIPQKLIAGSLTLPYLSLKLELDILHNPEQIGPITTKPFIPQVLTVHDLSPLILPQTFGRVARTYSSMIFPYIHNIDEIIAVSESTKRDLVKILDIHPGKIDVIHHGVGEEFRPIANEKIINDLKMKIGLVSPEESYILYLGFLEPRKNLIGLLDAYAELKKDVGIDEKLVIAGVPLLREHEVIKHIVTKNLEGEVLLTGFIEEGDMPALYSGAKIFVFPSLYEGFGLPILEAMSCGCPVCTSNISSLPEVGGEATRFFDPWDFNDISSVIQEMLSDDGLRRRMSALGLRRASTFTWSKCAKDTIETYSRVLR